MPPSVRVADGIAARMSSIVVISAIRWSTVALISAARVERVGKAATLLVDQGGDLDDALVEGGDDILAALGQRLGNVHDARRQGVGQGLGAPVERLLEASETLIERGGDFGCLAGDAVVEAVHAGRTTDSATLCVRAPGDVRPAVREP